MTKTYKKFDDVGWHSGDAANETQAAAHIALMYHWLRLRGMLNDSGLPTEESDVRKVSPGQFFVDWSDGKLVSEYMTPETVRFLDEYYSKTYLNIVGNQQVPNLRYDSRYELPYNIQDSWENVEAAAKFLDKEYAKRLERDKKGGFWKNLLGR